jgi:predicted small lipoprotein YifL
MARCSTVHYVGGMKTLIALFALFALTACTQEGPAEKAGRKLDNAADQAGRSIEKAGENMQDAARGKK